MKNVFLNKPRSKSHLNIFYQNCTYCMKKLNPFPSIMHIVKIECENDQEKPNLKLLTNPRATQQSRDTRKTNKAKQPALSSPSIPPKPKIVGENDQEIP